MKVQLIEKSIIKQYNNLELVQYIPRNKHYVISMLHNVKKNGKISPLDEIQTKNSLVSIGENSDITIERKPFWMSKKRVLKNVHKLLKHTISNLNDSNIVKKSSLNLKALF